MNQILNILLHKQVAPPIINHQGLCPSIIRAYTHQYTRARRQLRLLDRPEGWAPKVWSF